jgi:hypothetical protein
MKKLFITLCILLTGAFSVVVVAPAYAAPFIPNTAADSIKDACAGVSTSGGDCADNGTQLNNAIKVAINIFAVIVGVIAVIMVIIAGATFITSNGESGKLAKAKTSVIYAIVGMILVAAAETVVHFVIGSVK